VKLDFSIALLNIRSDIVYPEFENRLCDMEIYVDNHAGAMIHQVNSYVTVLRRLIMEKANVPQMIFI
jgi:hypothetical protein